MTKRRLRITYLHQYFNTPEMSGGTRSYEMARRLVAMGHKVNMVTSWREEGRRTSWFKTTEAGICVNWLPIQYANDMSYSQRMKAFCWFAWHASRLAASIPSDVVLATSTPLTIALPGVFAAKRQRVPMVFEVRDLWPELPIAMGALPNPIMRSAAQWLERFAYKNASRIIALSPGMRDGVVTSGFPADRVDVIPNSADLELFCVHPATSRLNGTLPSGPIVLYAGTLGRINGVSYLAQIARESDDNGARIQFVVVGDGHETGAVRELAAQLGVLGRNFHMYPPVPKRQMPEVLAAADVALSLFINLKPMWANSANKFFDALASGTPVAINYGGWQADLLNESGAGIVLPPDDPRRAALQLDELVQDVDRLNRAKQAALELASSRFNRDALARDLEAVLTSAANEFRVKNEASSEQLSDLG